jgi:hypothetical protein
MRVHGSASNLATPLAGGHEQFAISAHRTFLCRERRGDNYQLVCVYLGG